MKLLSKLTTTITAVIGAALLMSAPAYAGSAPCPPPAGGNHPTVVSDTGYQPLDSTKGNTYPQDEGCSAPLSIFIVADKVVERDVTYQNGDVKNFYKGKYVIQVSAPSTGQKIKLDDSGAYSVLTYANGDTYLELGGPAVIFPFSTGEAKAFRTAGLPSAFFYAQGEFHFYENAAQTHVDIYQVPKVVSNVCRALGLKNG